MTRVIIFGLDGATFDYMKPWLDAGDLPNLARLLARGTHGPLRSTFLPVTAIAWPSMLTGKNPGKHGIFDFRFRAPNSYTQLPSTTRRIRGNPLHEHLSRRNLRVGMVNVPMTYPPSDILGHIISGFTTPTNATDWAMPSSLSAQLDTAGVPYPMPLLHKLMEMEKTRRAQHEIERFIAGWDEFTTGQTDVVSHLLAHYQYDFFMVVFSATDHINHHTSKLDHIRRIYQQVDRAIGKIVKRLSDDTTILVVSDHGSAPLERYIVLYRLLADMGLISFHPEIAPRYVGVAASRLFGRPMPKLSSLYRHLPRAIRRALSWPALQVNQRPKYDYANIDWSHTQAYANSGIGTIFINLEGREPHGVVSPGTEYEALRDDIIEQLESLRDPQTGKRVIAKAIRSEKVYHGTYMDHAPDIVFSRRDPRYRAITGFASDPVIRSSRREDGSSAEHGYHTREGILIAAGPGFKRNSTIEDAHIFDIAPTVLHVLGLPVPTDVDGTVLRSLFEQQPDVVCEEPTQEEPAQTDTVFSQDEMTDFEERLRGLGYID